MTPYFNRQKARSTLTKTAAKLASTLGLACALGLAGCTTPGSHASLGGGYEEIRHSQIQWTQAAPPPARISLSYQNGNGHSRVIWPSLYCQNAVVHPPLAVFVAERDFLFEGKPEIRPRLFAVNPPHAPVDITEEILILWSQSTSHDLSQALKYYSLAIPQDDQGGLDISLKFWSGEIIHSDDWPDTGDVKLTWEQLVRIMEKIQAAGQPQKDPRWHTEFISL